MKTATILLQNAIRVLGVVLIVLGFFFWTGHAFALVRLHMDFGVALVILLWVLAVIAIRARVRAGFIVACFIWGLLVLIFGMTMGRFLPGRAHEVIRVLHFLIGLIAIALGEIISTRIKRGILLPAV